MKKSYIVIPTYNDWKSLNKLLQVLDKYQKTKALNTNILIINDCSSEELKIQKKKFKNFNSLNIINLKRNVGSQKAIFTGLKYLLKKTKKKNLEATFSVLDSDGEDDPSKLNQLVSLSIKNKNCFIFANRAKRTENFVLKIFNRIRLVLTYILTGYYINFGNFSSFSKRILKKILVNDNLYIAYSGGVLKNYKKIILYDVKKKNRYYGKSKVNFNFLLNHSIKIISIFYKRVFLRTFMILLLFIFFFNNLEIIGSSLTLFLFFNFSVYIFYRFSKLKHNVLENIKDIKVIKGGLI